RNRLLPLAREIRQRTGLDQRPPSIASMAVDQLLAVGTRIAIVGAGATGRLLLEILQRRQVVPVLIANRSVDKAAALAQHYGGRALSLHEFVRGTDPALRELDGVAVAVRSDEPVLDRRSVGSRVGTLPRTSANTRSGRRRSSAARRRCDEVPTRQPLRNGTVPLRS